MERFVSLERVNNVALKPREIVSIFQVVEQKKIRNNTDPIL